MSDETKVIHGLDELVYYYQNQPCSGLQHRLDKFVPNEKCPTSVRLHGVDNLLHRATQVEILITFIIFVRNGFVPCLSLIFACMILIPGASIKGGQGWQLPPHILAE